MTHSIKRFLFKISDLKASLCIWICSYEIFTYMKITVNSKFLCVNFYLRRYHIFYRNKQCFSGNEVLRWNAECSVYCCMQRKIYNYRPAVVRNLCLLLLGYRSSDADFYLRISEWFLRRVQKLGLQMAYSDWL